MSIGLILLIIVVLMLLGAVPAWPHSRGWGYGPSGGLGLVLIILLVLLVLGRLCVAVIADALRQVLRPNHPVAHRGGADHRVLELANVSRPRIAIE